MARERQAVRIVRPYLNEDDLLANELETINRTGILLVGAYARPRGTIIRFEVTLSNGSVVLRGEGRVVDFHEHAFKGEPGLLLRFTMLDSRSKALVDHAMTLREGRRAGVQSVPAPRASAPPSFPSEAPPPSVPVPRGARSSSMPPPEPRAPEPRAPEPRAPEPRAGEISATSTEVAPAAAATQPARASQASSNRDHLLASLRERANRLTREQRNALMSKRGSD